MINIKSDLGRIGEIWWFNSDPATPIWVPLVRLRCVRWGTFGFGRNVRMFFEPIER